MNKNIFLEKFVGKNLLKLVTSDNFNRVDNNILKIINYQLLIISYISIQNFLHAIPKIFFNQYFKTKPLSI